MYTAKTLEARAHTHGSFHDNAYICQELKLLFRRVSRHAQTEGEITPWEGLTNVHREALDMIAVKICRILSGDANEPDHWHDIAGYATLAEKYCRGALK